MFPSGYSSRQLIQDQTPSSSASSLRPQQTHLEGTSRHSSRNTYFSDAMERESELGYLLSPPSPPPSLDQVLSARSNSNTQRPTPIPSPYRGHQSLYDHIERELLSEHSGSHQQPDAGAIPTPDLNSRYQSLYNDFAQALSMAPDSSNSSSRRQSAANQSTPSAAQASYSRYPGVVYDSQRGKYRIRWTDPSQGRRISFGSYSTQSEAIRRLEDYKASHSARPFLSNHPGVYRNHSGKWQARYVVQGERVYVGSFRTREEAERALRENRAARGLSPVRGRRGE